jgi:hypothetical protein
MVDVRRKHCQRKECYNSMICYRSWLSPVGIYQSNVANPQRTELVISGLDQTYASTLQGDLVSNNCGVLFNRWMLEVPRGF